MPRRRALTEAQLETLLALPTADADLVRHWTLGRDDFARTDRRRGAANQLGYALQLCAFRYPGRLLRPGEAIPEAALRFVAAQLHVGADALAAYAARPQTRREQLDGLRAVFGFHAYGPGHGRELLAWLLPVALATTDAFAVARTLMDELRRRRIVTAGPSTVERLVAGSLVLAERHVAGQLTRALTPSQAEALDALLAPKEGTAMSILAWARQPPEAPGHKALARVVEQLGVLRAVGFDPACAEGVHPERLRKLAREGGRYTAQHLRALSPLRRQATLVATVLDTAMRLTDDGVGLFDRAVGRMFRRAEVGEERAVLRDARAVNDKVRLLAKLGTALIAAKADGADLDGAVDTAVGWNRLAASVAEAVQLARPDKVDLPALAARAWPVLHRLGPAFLDAFRLRAMPAASTTLRAVELLTLTYGGSGRHWPKSLPTAFLRPAWRDAVLDAETAGISAHRHTWEAATLLALRDRLRADDIWVEGSRQWRAVEDQLIPRPLFAAMRAAGPLPLAVPATAGEYLAEHRALLERRLAEVEAKAAAERLENVRIRGGELTVTPLEAVTPEAAEALAGRLYGMVPNARVTGVLAEGALPPPGHPARGRGGLRRGRAVPSRGRAEHLRPPHGRRRGVGPQLRADVPARRPLCPAHPQSRRPQAVCFRPRLDLADAGAVHRRKAGRQTDRSALGRRAAAGGLRAYGPGQRVLDAPAPGRLPTAERPGARLARGRAHRAHALHPGLAGAAPASPSGHGRAEQGCESRNALTRAVCFHRLGRLRDRAAELQQHRASGLALVTAAIALWNTVYLGRAVDALRREGEAIPDALLAHLAPLGWQHINFTGDYIWGADGSPGPDGFRPPRRFPPPPGASRVAAA